jgi:hypothetical protein
LITPEKTRRLAFVKYLLRLANGQVKQAEPLASAAVLMFHDAAELFLDLAAEHLNLKKKDQSFMAY